MRAAVVSMMRWATLLFLVGMLGGCGRTPLSPFLELDEALDQDEDPLSEGCNKVDYLFVVDNSSSMGDNQHKLSQSVVAFVDGVEQALDTVDSIHVGVVTTDGYDHAREGCGGLGGLVTQTGGHNSSQMVCGPYASGGNYMTDNDDLQATIECATLVGTTGSNAEQPLIAAREAIAPRDPDTRECNLGFLRPDALLVVVFLTDEDANAGTGTYDALVDAKNGYDDSIVVITLAHLDREMCSLGGHASIASNLIGFTDSFEHGLVSSICANSFAQPFEDATRVIEQACG